MVNQSMAKRVLLVDDEPAVIAPFQMYLERKGYEVVVAYDGKAGLEQARSAKPDAIVLDVCMPEMDGKEVLKRLRADASTANIPVIVLTGVATGNEDITETWTVGVETHLAKPCEPAELALWLERILAGAE